MVGLVLAAHGTFGDGLLSGVELLAGKQRQLEVVGLCHGDDPVMFERRLADAIERADSGAGVLCLVDVLGGTPSNTVMKLMRRRRVRALSGANLPAAIQAVFRRGDLDLDELAGETLRAQQEGAVDLGARLASAQGDAFSSAARTEDDPGPLSSDASTRPSREKAAEASADRGRVVLFRVDDRLIHGQVMTSWLNATGANKIMIVDDETAENPFLRNVFKSAVPAGVGVGVFSEQKGADRLIRGFKAQDRVIVLAKLPQTFLSLVGRGAAVDRLVIGGMGAREDRSRLYRNISASDAERAALAELIDRGVEVHIQILADDAKVDVSRLLA